MSMIFRRLLFTSVIGLLMVFYTVSHAQISSDFNHDNEVGFADFILFVQNFGKQTGDADFDAQYDLDGDGSVAFPDFISFVGSFGTKSSEQDPVRSLPEGLTFVAVSGGTFTMGSDAPGPDADNRVPHSVTLSEFWISETEVTNTQFVTFLNAAAEKGWLVVEEETAGSPCGIMTDQVVKGAGVAPYMGEVYVTLSQTGGCTSDGKAESDLNRSWIVYDAPSKTFSVLDLGDGEDRGNWPVTWMKWYGAAAFAEFYAFTLPTEAQWEYAARSGNDATVYATSTGDLDFTVANYNGTVPNAHNAEGHVFAVRTYAPNPWGLYEMSGNVWEWCQDYYAADFYGQTAQETNPVNTTVSETRVKRGGSWNFHATTLSVYARDDDFPNRGNNHFGFRVVSKTAP